MNRQEIINRINAIVFDVRKSGSNSSIEREASSYLFGCLVSLKNEIELSKDTRESRRFNLNDEVRIELRHKGVEILQADGNHSPFPDKTLVMPMHEVMRIFGPHIQSFLSTPISPTIELVR